MVQVLQAGSPASGMGLGRVCLDLNFDLEQPHPGASSTQRHCCWLATTFLQCTLEEGMSRCSSVKTWVVGKQYNRVRQAQPPRASMLWHDRSINETAEAAAGWRALRARTQQNIEGGTVQHSCRAHRSRRACAALIILGSTWQL